jgi:molybdenum cofactor biosynthesis enzyme MoaA
MSANTGVIKLTPMNSQTFCSAPWFQVRLDWDGHYRPCCEFNENLSNFPGNTKFSSENCSIEQWMGGEYSQYLREQLSNGVELAECQSCWNKEKYGFKSLRNIINDTTTKNHGDNIKSTWVASYLKTLKNYSEYYLISADIKLSNVCNFACIMCSPQDSSRIYDLWYKTQTNQFVQEQIKKDDKLFEKIIKVYGNDRTYKRFESIFNHPIKYLKFLGGEPLLDKNLLKMLNNLDPNKKSKITLHFVTNGSQNLTEFADQLKDFANITFTVSLESVGEMQDYARKGSDWAEIEKNILTAKNQGIHISISTVIQAVTLPNIDQLLTWVQKNDLSISFLPLTGFEYLDISVLPATIRQKTINKLNLLSDDLNAKKLIDLIESYLHHQEKYQKFLEYISWYEKDSVTKLQDLEPVFYNFD